MTAIISVIGREIIDSRGNPTVEVDVELADGSLGRAAVPSGASTGSLEAWELRDGDKERFDGKGVLQAVDHINGEICDLITGLDAEDQVKIDRVMIELDATENKSRLGANAMLGVSLAVAHAAAKAVGLPLYRYLGGANACRLPVPMMNIINGGAHANNSIDIQEFMIMPVGAENCREAIRMGCEVFHALRTLLADDGHSIAVGDEGGFAPNLKSTDEALSYVMKAVEKAGYRAQDDILLALDAASSEFYGDGRYNLTGEGKVFDATQLTDYYESLLSRYPITSIEDAMAENDHEGWKIITDTLGDKIQLVGDDLFVTNPEILADGIKQGIANAILIKVNQIGTLTETLQAVELAQNNAYGAILSHRSGETEDSTIAHIAVATGCGQIKTGSLSRSDRTAKYNELIRIEEALGKQAIYGR